MWEIFVLGQGRRLGMLRVCSAGIFGVTSGQQHLLRQVAAVDCGKYACLFDVCLIWALEGHAIGMGNTDESLE
jgi:hypothetical protein